QRREISTRSRVVRQQHRPVSSRHQAMHSPAQALPRRSVCAPAALAFSLYRRPVPERRNIMWFSSWLRNRTSNRAPRRRATHRAAAPRFRPRLEALEDRTVPSQVTLTVSSLADSGSGTLRAAILAADAGRQSDKFTINFSVSGTITLESALPDLNNNIEIDGPGVGGLTVQRDPTISADFSVLTVDSGATVGISALTIADGTGFFSRGGGIYNTGTLTVSSCTLSGNFVSYGGG